MGTAFSALFTSFDNVYGSGVENGVASSSTVFDDALNSVDMGGKSNASDAPRAYLNYLFFDKDMNYVTAGFAQIESASNGMMAPVSTPDFIADREGYVMVYLSNETQGMELIISWDDFTIYHGKTNIVSTQDYYPFGLTFNESQRTGSVKNRFNTFQDQEYEEETGWVKFKWRNHMPDIGKFFNIDPLAEKYLHNSPYAFSENKLISYRELEGLEAELSIAGLGAQGGRDDQTFVSRARTHAGATGGTAVSVSTGSDFVGALQDATSSEGSISGVTVLSHGGPDAIYMNAGEGFYSSVSSNTWGANGAGASDISALNTAIEDGSIVFEEGATIVLGGCNCGQVLGPDITESTGITTISSTSNVSPEIVDGVETGRLVSDTNFIRTELVEQTNTITVPGRIDVTGSRNPSTNTEVTTCEIQQTDLGNVIDPTQQ